MAYVFWISVQVYQSISGNTSFIELSQRGKFIGIVPSDSLLELITKKHIEAFDPKIIIDLEEVLPVLRPAVKRNIEMWNRPTDRKNQ